MNDNETDPGTLQRRRKLPEDAIVGYRRRVSKVGYSRRQMLVLPSQPSHPWMAGEISPVHGPLGSRGDAKGVDPVAASTLRSSLNHTALP